MHVSVLLTGYCTVMRLSLSDHCRRPIAILRVVGVDSVKTVNMFFIKGRGRFLDIKGWLAGNPLAWK